MEMQSVARIPSKRKVALAEGPLARMLSRDHGLWRAAMAGLWGASSLGVSIGMMGMPTGLGILFDLLAAITLNTAGFAGAVLLMSWLMSYLRRPRIPGGTLGGYLYTTIFVYCILYFSGLGEIFSCLFACIYPIVGALFAVLPTMMATRRLGGRQRTAAGVAVVLLLLTCFYGTGGRIHIPVRTASFDLADQDSSDNAAGDKESLNAIGQEAGSVQPLATDPSLPGGFSYEAFAYGSGSDKHREAFGSGVLLTSAPADASAYIEKWPLLRNWFWGFGADRLPLNGRVWMPEGDGPFPLVLMVHGNHAMEDFSDAGYAYLGQQLASRGFIAISVDENFLNNSAWSGIPKQDMKLRAWVLLKHIGQLQAFAADSSTPFYGKIDFDRMALIGHSRGGQAVAMAADRDKWFAADAALPAMDSYRIRSIIALAPTDNAVDGQQAKLSDIAYLSLQGASDGDVNDFYGERQYLRTTFTGTDPSLFKATLYIKGANHGQFNTDWGARDSSLPAGLFLRKPDLSESEQQQVAKLYVSAFLESTLHEDSRDDELFEDYRAGIGYLPDTAYYNRYEDAAFHPIARFDDSTSNTLHPSKTTTADSAGLTSKVEEALDREQQGKGTHGLTLQWTGEGGFYRLASASPLGLPSSQGATQALVFAMADLSHELDDDETAVSAAGLRIRLTDAQGEEATLTLDDYHAPLAPPRTSITRLSWLETHMDDGKYSEAVEPAFQTYALPLADFVAQNARLALNRIMAVTFLVAGDTGRIMLDDIGLASL